MYANNGEGGEQLSENYYRSARKPKSLWRTSSDHIQGYHSDPERYEKAVVDFFDETLLP
jgi:hypothetical protein